MSSGKGSPQLLLHSLTSSSSIIWCQALWSCLKHPGCFLCLLPSGDNPLWSKSIFPLPLMFSLAFQHKRGSENWRVWHLYLASNSTSHFLTQVSCGQIVPCSPKFLSDHLKPLCLRCPLRNMSPWGVPSAQLAENNTDFLAKPLWRLETGLGRLSTTDWCQSQALNATVCFPVS